MPRSPATNQIMPRVPATMRYQIHNPVPKAIQQAIRPRTRNTAEAAK